MIHNKITKIICFGEVLWDMLPSGAKPGGAPLNVAIHLKKQGLSPNLISKIGNDTDGKELLQFLKSSNVNSNFIQKDNKLPTSKVLVQLDKHKNATYEICEPVAWDNIVWNTEIANLIADANIVLYGSLATRNSTSLKTLQKIVENTDAIKLIDVNLRPPYDNKKHVENLLKISDFIKLNDDELNTIAGWNGKTGSLNELIVWISDFFNCPTVCVTRGENGAILYIEKKIIEHPGFKIKVVDTVGAGDSFLASLIANLSQNKSPETALEYACATGAFVASRPGAVPDYSIKDILEIIKNKQAF